MAEAGTGASSAFQDAGSSQSLHAVQCGAEAPPPPAAERGSGGYMWVGLGRYSSAFLGTELLQRSDGMGREGTPYRRSRPADVAQT